MRQFLVQLLAFFCKPRAVKLHGAQNFQERVDLALRRIELINDDNLLIFKQTVSRLKVTLLIAQRIVRLRDHIFQLREKLNGVFDHSFNAFSRAKDNENNRSNKRPAKFGAEMTNRNKLIVVAGPTAVGKTAVSIRIAHYFGTEIISADARQLYREMNIGTAKPTEEERAAVPHHFVNMLSVSDEYDAARYGKEALACLHQCFSRHEAVILCGGSGLYIKALLEGFDDIPEVDPKIRAAVRQLYEAQGLEALQRRMEMLDPEHYQRIDSQNPQRLMRALEVVEGTGRSIASFRQNNRREHDFDVIKIGLELPRNELYMRIDQRMDKMIADGLFEEAESLYAHRHLNALQTVGYQEIFGYIDGRYDRVEAVRLLKQHSRQYAKRQLTWFKRDTEMTWLHPAGIDDILDVAHGKKSS